MLNLQREYFTIFSICVYYDLYDASFWSLGYAVPPLLSLSLWLLNVYFRQLDSLQRQSVRKYETNFENKSSDSSVCPPVWQNLDRSREEIN